MIRPRSWEGRADALLAALEEERRLIRRGELARLGERTAISTAALDALVASAPPGDDEAAAPRWRAIRDAAERNRRLLEAALVGIRQARGILAAQAEAGRRLGYDRNGGELRFADARRDRRA